MGTLLFVEVIHIGLVLEEVGVQIAAFHGQVWLHIVGVFDDLQIHSLGLEILLHLSQNLSMGSGASAHLQFYQLAVVSGFVVPAATGHHAQTQQSAQGNNQYLFHSKSLQLMVLLARYFFIYTMVTFSCQPCGR